MRARIEGETMGQVALIIARLTLREDMPVVSVIIGLVGLSNLSRAARTAIS